jgi:MFS family permease
MVMWCFHVLAIFLLDRVGRRPLLLTGVVGQVVGLAILGAAFQFQQFANFKSYIAIGGLVIYVACFAFGLGPIFWLLISEIYPLKVRGAAMVLTRDVRRWLGSAHSGPSGDAVGSLKVDKKDLTRLGWWGLRC